MNELIIQYREYSHKAIRDYEHGFNEDKHMSLRRSKDILAIKEILNKPWKEVNSCILAVKSYLDAMETGWWIFKTGKSLLKDHLNKLICSYEDPVAQSLMGYSSLVQSKLEEAMGCIVKMSSQQNSYKLLEDKNDQIQALEQTVIQLKQEMDNLLQQNHELSKKLIESKRVLSSAESFSSPCKEQVKELKSVVGY